MASEKMPPEIKVPAGAATRHTDRGTERSGSRGGADPLDDLVRRPSRAASASLSSKPVPSGSAYLYAFLASLIWIAVVLAYCWSYFGLPPSLSAGLALASERIQPNDWMLIAAALLAPLLLIWVIAALLRRSTEMRHHSRQLSNAASQLALVARSTPQRTPILSEQAAIDAGGGPRHFNREVERATHAVSAMHSQMEAIEEALSRQAAAVDDVAERALNRAKDIAATLQTERVALEGMTSRLGAVMPTQPASALGGAIQPEQHIASHPSAPSPAASLAATSAAIGAAVAARAETPPDIVDFTLGGQGVSSGEAVDPFELSTVVPPEPARTGPRIAMPTPPTRSGFDWTKFVRAANFPVDDQDSATLNAIYDVLTDLEAGSLLQSAEDTLASLAELDLYMDDLTPQLAPISAWKQVAETGTSASNPSHMPAITAPLEQNRVAAKRKADIGFLELGDRFLERYEAMLRRLINESGDERALVELSNTRTGRAYLLVAQASGRIVDTP